MRGNRRQSEAIKRQSDVIGDNQCQSESIRGNQRQSERGRRQSEAIRCNPRQSEAIRANQRQSEVIRGHQSEAIRCRAVPWGVEDHHALEGSPADISRAPSLWACRWRRRGRVNGAVCGLDARVGAHLWGKSGGAVVGTCMQGRGVRVGAHRELVVRPDVANGRVIPFWGG